MIWPFVSRRAYDLVCAELKLAREQNERYLRTILAVTPSPAAQLMTHPPKPIEPVDPLDEPDPNAPWEEHQAWWERMNAAAVTEAKKEAS